MHVPEEDTVQPGSLAQSVGEVELGQACSWHVPPVAVGFHSHCESSTHAVCVKYAHGFDAQRTPVHWHCGSSTHVAWSVYKHLRLTQIDSESSAHTGSLMHCRRPVDVVAS